MTYKEEAVKREKTSSVSSEAVKAATKLGLRKKCSNALTSGQWSVTAHDEAPVEFILTPEGVVRKEEAGLGDQFDPYLEKKDVLMVDMCDLVQGDQMSLSVGPGITFTEEERKRVQHLVGLDQTILISFNDLEEEVAVKVITFRDCKSRIFLFRFSMRCTKRLFHLGRWTISLYFGDTPLP